MSSSPRRHDAGGGVIKGDDSHTMLETLIACLETAVDALSSADDIYDDEGDVRSASPLRDSIDRQDAHRNVRAAAIETEMETLKDFVRFHRDTYAFPTELEARQRFDVLFSLLVQQRLCQR